MQGPTPTSSASKNDLTADRWRAVLLEPISQLLQAHHSLGELHKSEKAGAVILPANEEASFPLKPRNEAFDESATFVPSRVTAIVNLAIACGARGHKKVHAVLCEVVIKPARLKARLPIQMLQFDLPYVEIGSNKREEAGFPISIPAEHRTICCELWRKTAEQEDLDLAAEEDVTGRDT